MEYGRPKVVDLGLYIVISMKRKMILSYELFICIEFKRTLKQSHFPISLVNRLHC